MNHFAENLTFEDVNLRRWRVEDVDALHAVVVEAREHHAPWAPWPRQDRGGTEGFVRRSIEEWHSGTSYAFGIYLDMALVGGIRLFNRRGPGVLEIGYWLHPVAIGRGVATKATQALIASAFELPGIEAVVIAHDADNLRSGAVPARLGFTEIERVPVEPHHPGESGIAVVWRLTRNAQQV
ncbi:GNAT family N-acetyltransferase [Catellatospora sp. NPDC049609]|uniref:GNAT family N-acetyltransferase n=1 Tax=Catellatospora sp. NPDC049609 TaxID=3155505 RepID=UPI003422248E